MYYASRLLPEVAEIPWFLKEHPKDLEPWLDDAGIPDGVPFLLSPSLEYDADLNRYFLVFAGAPRNSNSNRAQAMKGFFDFLWQARGGKGWRDATDDDHLAFHYWRRRDPCGPMVAGSTWSAEVSHVNKFYLWAAKNGLTSATPVPLRERRPAPAGTAAAPRGPGEGLAPATFAHDERGERMEWLPPKSYRLWRDVGLRGYSPDGLPRDGFRGRWAARNSAFADLMVRTGMRLEEQASLLAAEVPHAPGPAGYQRFWLPAVIAKCDSARWVYVPRSVRRDLEGYADFDRPEAIASARAAGRYDVIRKPLVIADPSRPGIAVRAGSPSRPAVKVAHLTPDQRYRLLADTGSGLEPAMFWLAESGMPVALPTWKDMFATAGRRCQRQGVTLSCHAHTLRHSFAVVTLEQLQRGHIAALAALNPEQRGHYTRIFGDPLDWVRRRLGHSTVASTLIYLHALQELEMETRMALVPDTWEDPRDTPLDQLCGTAGEAPGPGLAQAAAW